MNAPFDAGYSYEVAGLVYYVFFLFMMRGANANRYSQRSRVLVIAAAIALVGSVPFRYASAPGGVAVMLALAVASLLSCFADTRRR